MDEAAFRARTKSFALEVIRLTITLPRSREAEVIARQLVRCSTSVGANYRAACRAKSRLDMLAKLAIVEEEADEAMYWLELLAEVLPLTRARTLELHREANELVAMTVASMKTLRGSVTAVQNPKSKIQNG